MCEDCKAKDEELKKLRTELLETNKSLNEKEKEIFEKEKELLKSQNELTKAKNDLTTEQERAKELEGKIETTANSEDEPDVVEGKQKEQYDETFDEFYIVD